MQVFPVRMAFGRARQELQRGDRLLISDYKGILNIYEELEDNKLEWEVPYIADRQIELVKGTRDSFCLH